MTAYTDDVLDPRALADTVAVLAMRRGAYDDVRIIDQVCGLLTLAAAHEGASVRPLYPAARATATRHPRRGAA